MYFSKTKITVAIFFASVIPLSSDSLIEPYIKFDKGNVEYSVHNNEITNYLESKLVFPIESNLVGLNYINSSTLGTFKIGYETIIQSDITKNGEDFDWKNNELIVYSYSKNTIKKNKSYFVEYLKPIKINFINHLGFSIENKSYLFEWQNTTQSNQLAPLTGRTLLYEYEINKYGLSILSNKADSSFLYNLKLNYYDIESLDNHLLRNMTMKTNYSGIGYEVKMGYKYTKNENNIFKILYSLERFNSDKADMNYFKSGNYQYKFPSNSQFSLNSLSLSYEYKF